MRSAVVRNFIILCAALFIPTGADANVYVASDEGMAVVLDSVDAYVRSVKAYGRDSTRYVSRAETLVALRELLDSSEPGSEPFTFAATNLAAYYKSRESHDLASYFTALAAFSELKADNEHRPMLRRLAADLFQRGDRRRAYNYMVKATADDIDCELSDSTLTLHNNIVMTYVDELRSQLLVLRIVVITLIVMMIAIVAYLIRAKRLQHSAQRQQCGACTAPNLARAFLLSYLASVKENDSMTKLILRKIKTGQTRDLYRQVEEGSAAKENTDKFLQEFDRAILNNFPNFVDQVNSLLRDDSQIEIESTAARLTPELRIAALVAFGVEDGDDIARLLGLSLNTVYTYRNKLRNRARDKSHFDEKLRIILC